VAQFARGIARDTHVHAAHPAGVEWIALGALWGVCIVGAVLAVTEARSALTAVLPRVAVVA